MNIKYNALEDQNNKEKQIKYFINKLETPITHHYRACKKCPICHSTNSLVTYDIDHSDSDHFSRELYKLSFVCSNCKSRWESEPFFMRIISSRYKTNGDIFELDKWDSSTSKKTLIKKLVTSILLVLFVLIVSISVGNRLGLIAGIVCFLILGVVSLLLYLGITGNDSDFVESLMTELDGENKQIKSKNKNECYVYLEQYGNSELEKCINIAISEIIKQIKTTR